MVKKINQGKPEKPTRAVKPVVAGKPNAGGKKTASGKPAKDSAVNSGVVKNNAAKKRDTGDRFAPEKSAGGKSAKSTGKPARTSGQSIKPKVARDADERAPSVIAPDDEKLQKVLARAGIGSRREMERAIEAGQVKVNDRIATLGD